MSQQLNTPISYPKKIISAYEPKHQLQIHFSGQGRTKQSFKDECDINVIIRRFLKTGQLDLAQRLEPRYGDATGIEFQAALQKVAAARTLFAELPAALRARFDNDPAKLLHFVHDEKNREEGIELGLFTKPAATPAPSGATTTPPAAPAAA